MFTLPPVPEYVRAANTFKANTPCLKRKVKCHRRGRSSHILPAGAAELCRALRAPKGLRHEHREPLRFVCSWEDTGSEYEHGALLIIDPCFPFFFLLVCICCLSAALLSASEIDLCFQVCCYGEISLLLCVLFQGLWVLGKESCAEQLDLIIHLFFGVIFLLRFAPRSRSEVLQANFSFVFCWSESRVLDYSQSS